MNTGSRIPKFPGSLKRPREIEDVPKFPGIEKKPRQNENNTPAAGSSRAKKPSLVRQQATCYKLPPKPMQRSVSSSKATDFAKFTSSKTALFHPPKSVPSVRESMPVLRNINAQSSIPPPVKKPKRANWDHKGRLQDVEEDNKKLLEVVEASNSRIAALEAAQVQLNQDVEIKHAEKASVSAQVQSLTQKIHLLKQENAIQATTIQELNSQIKQMSQQVSTCAMENETLKAEVAASKSLICSMTANKNILQTQYESVKILLEQRESQIEQKESQINSLSQKIDSLTQDNLKQYTELQANEKERRIQHNLIMELKGNIRVFCRLRPPLASELKKSVPLATISCKDEKTLEIVDPTSGKSGKNHEFTFDHVFRKSDSQAEVFSEISQLVQSTLDGYNVCIFAYGQTGSGKTYTMEGPEDMKFFLSDSEQLGMIPRSVNHIFQVIEDLEKKEWKYTMEAAFIEIYNENVRDLLNYSAKCEIKMASKGNDCQVSNLTTVPITSNLQVYDLLRRAKSSRTVATTKCNEHSSRSHYIFQMKLTGTNAGTEEKCEGILNLVDLAGSERVKESCSTGTRLTEAKNINQSLSELGNVIMALSQKAEHVPYRNSKLTRLLMNSLGGNSKTMMFVNISPCEDSVNESINSLRFATKVNQCNIGTAQKRIR